MNVLITGAKGFVGKNLVCALKNIKDGKDRTRPELNIEEIYSYDIDSSESELDYACKNHSLNILKKYILRGIMNNIIFDTKNKKEINTEKMVREIVGELRRY